MVFICLLSTAIVAEAVLKINQSYLPRAIPGAIILLRNNLVKLVFHQWKFPHPLTQDMTYE